MKKRPTHEAASVMTRNTVVVILFAVVILLVSLAGAFYLGVAPAPGGESDDTITDFPTATSLDGESGSDGGAETTSSSETASFSFTIDEVEECTQPCRDVTVTMHNNQDETATGVSVFTRIFAGQNNADPDALVWEGTKEVGTLEAGGSNTTTARVELSLQEGLMIERNDGWVTVVTTVQTDERTVVFRDTEQVA